MHPLRSSSRSGIGHKGYVVTLFKVPMRRLAFRGVVVVQASGALLNFEDLVRYPTMRLTMYHSSGFFARSIAQAEDCPIHFVVPVADVVHSYLPCVSRSFL